MRLDWELARRGYRRYAAYPAATLAVHEPDIEEVVRRIYTSST